MPISKIIWHEYAPICAKCGEDVTPLDYKYFYLNRADEVAIYFHKECSPKSDKEFAEYNIRIIR